MPLLSQVKTQQAQQVNLHAPAPPPELPTICVVIPCYNGMPYLPQALDSALAQTFSPTGILVVDDGSTDASADCVRQYIHKHPDRNIRLLQQANAGEPAARNTGINATTAQWVAMLDTDDWWEPNKLELQLQAAQAAGPQCVLVHTGVIKHFPDGTQTPMDLDGPSRRTGWCTQALLEPTSIGHPSILVRHQAVQKIGGYNPAFRQACDIDLYFRLSAVGTFAFVPQHLLHYRVHAKQMSVSQMNQISFHHRAIRQFFAQHPRIAAEVGDEYIQTAMAEHIAIKLQSLYWKRQLDEFRQLLRYADQHHLDSPNLRQWRRRALWPNWLIHFRDRLSSNPPTPKPASNPTPDSH